MSSLNVHFSSESNEWETPQYLFDGLNAEFGFELDVCATAQNAKCKRFFTKEDNALDRPWAPAVCWMNPPYGREIAKFLKKGFEEVQLGATVVALLPARTDTRYWGRFVTRAEVRFLRGRLRFVGAKHPAPFPSAVAIWRPPRCG